MSSRNQELLTSLTENLEKVQTFLTANKLPDLSIDTDLPLSTYLNPEFASSRDAAIIACKELIDILSNPVDIILRLSSWEYANVHGICKLGIATSFPANQDTTTYDEISKKCNLPEPDVRRIVRATLPARVYQEKSNGVIAHTAASRQLAENALLRGFLEASINECIIPICKYPEAMEKWPGSEEANQVGYSLIHDTEDHAYVHMAKFPGRIEKFAAAMSIFSSLPENSPRFIFDNYPWADIGTGTIVDVGGSTGVYTIPVVKAHPGLKCIIQELPGVVEKLEPGLPDDVKDKVSFMPHDFFTEQPVKGADVYFMRWILHDWSDKYASLILKALVPAMRRNSKIVIHEHIVPEPGEISPLQEKALRRLDTTMRGMSNGKEREVRDWKALIARADPRLRITKMGTPKGSALGIIEVELAA